MTNRRSFLKGIAAAGIASSIPANILSHPAFLSQQKTAQSKDKVWANLIHLSYNMWHDHSNVVWDNLPADTYSSPNFKPKTCMDARRWARGYRPFLTFDEDTWNAILRQMADRGMNMMVIDLGDAIKYNSHPEIAVENAWSTEKLKAELAKMRKMGIEPIPKLNFSTSHHAWLGEYSRMVSTKKYYSVCKNLINEVIELFDTPRYFHLGMDEEIYHHQKDYNYVTVRQNDLWWHDFYLLMEEVEKSNVRSWIWTPSSDPEIFYKKMPKSVIQSSWTYASKREDFNNLSNSKLAHRIKFYSDLEKHGYDQIPTGSNHSNDENMEAHVEYLSKVLDESKLLGFMTAPWRPTLAPCLDTHIAAIDQMGNAIKNF